MCPTLASTTPIDDYTRTLPHVTAQTLEGQGFLWAKGDAPTELAADVELADVDPRQGVLAGFGGVLNVRTWVRGKRKRLPWDQLDMKLAGLDKHRGRTWTEWDDETMRQVRRQTWNVSDLAQRRIAPPSWLNTDAIVSPVTGDLVRFCRNPRARRMLEILWAAFEEGSGGVMLSREHWATVLHCSPRSVYNYQRELVSLGLARKVPTWRRRVGGKPGSGREHVLLRIGPTVESLAGIEPLARRSTKRSGVDVDQALRLAVALRKRMRLRGQHVTDALWRQQDLWRRSAKDRASVARTSHCDLSVRSSKRQTMPNSPPLVTAGLPAVAVGSPRYARPVFGGAPPVDAVGVVDPKPTNAAVRPVLALRAGKKLDTDPAFADILAEGEQGSFAALFLAGFK